MWPGALSSDVLLYCLPTAVCAIVLRLQETVQKGNFSCSVVYSDADENSKNLLSKTDTGGCSLCYSLELYISVSLLHVTRIFQCLHKAWGSKWMLIQCHTSLSIRATQSTKPANHGLDWRYYCSNWSAQYFLRVFIYLMPSRGPCKLFGFSSFPLPPAASTAASIPVESDTNHTQSETRLNPATC